MSDHEDHDFNQGDSGASETFPMQCSALRKGGFVMIKVTSYLVQLYLRPRLVGYTCLLLNVSSSESALQDRRDVDLKDWEAWARQGAFGGSGHLHR